MSTCRKIYVYRFVNLKNGKCYVGSTNNIHNRVIGHQTAARLIKHNNTRFYRAVTKYGWNNFELQILEEDICPIQEVRNARENYWIQFFDTLNSDYGYNLKTADCKDMSEETRDKLRRWNTGRTMSDEAKQKMRNAKLGKPGPWLGKTRSDETKKKISQIQIGKKLPEEVCLKMSNSRKGRKMSPESVEKTRQAHLGKKRTDKTREALSKSHLGKPWSDKRRDTYNRLKQEHYMTPEQAKEKARLRAIEKRKNMTEEERKHYLERRRQSKLKNKKQIVRLGV